MSYLKIFLLTAFVMLSGRLSADNITVDNQRITPGETKKVGIVLNNPNNQYVAFQFDFVVPDGITVANNENGKPDITLNEERSDDHTLIVQDNGSGEYRLISYSMPVSAFSGTDGVLVYVTLNVASNCAEDNKSVVIKSQRFTTIDKEEKKWDDMSFVIEVKKGETGGQGDEPVADVDHLKIDDVYIAPGGTRWIAIQLDNKNRRYVGFQFELMLPAGISIVNEGGKFLASMNSSRSEDHELSVVSVGNNTYRFLAYSMPIVEFAGTEGNLVYVLLQNDGNIGEGELIGSIRSQRLTAINPESQGGYEEVKLADVSFNIHVGTVPGDANGDGELNETDRNYIVRHIMGDTPDDFDEEAANLNGDEKIDVADIVLLNKLLGENPSSLP